MNLSSGLWLVTVLLGIASGQYASETGDLLADSGEQEKGAKHKTPHSTTSSACSISTSTQTKWETTTCYVTVSPSPSV